MQKCDNCKTEFDASKEGVVTTSRGRHAAAICGGCCDGARTVKLVLKKRDVGGFAYEQFQAIEMAKAAG
jgi:hypothetical protein